MPSLPVLPILLVLLQASPPAAARLEEPSGGGAVVFSPDGRWLASHGSMGFHLWEAATGHEKPLEKGSKQARQDPERHFAFTPDSSQIVLFDSGQFRVWEVRSGSLLRTLPGPRGFFTTALLSPSGAAFAAAFSARPGESSVDLTDLAEAKTTSLEVPEGHIESLTLSGQGDRLATSGTVARRGLRQAWVKAWEVPQGKELWSSRLEAPGQPRGVLARTPPGSFAPDGKLLAVLQIPGAVIPGRIGGAPQILVWDAQTGAPRAKLEGHTGQVWDFSWGSPRGRLASFGESELMVWDLEGQKAILSERGMVHQAILDPSARTVAWISSPDLAREKERSVSVLDLDQGRERFRLEPAYYHDLAFSPDGMTLAVSSDLRIALYDAVTGKLRGDR